MPWPFPSIALPGWIRVDEFLTPYNVVSVDPRRAVGSRNFQAADVGAVVRFALTCDPGTPWLHTVIGACDDDPETEQRLKTILLNYGERQARREARKARP